MSNWIKYKRFLINLDMVQEISFYERYELYFIKFSLINPENPETEFDFVKEDERKIFMDKILSVLNPENIN